MINVENIGKEAYDHEPIAAGIKKQESGVQRGLFNSSIETTND